MTQMQIVILAAGCVVFYMYVRYRVAKLFQPFRMGLLDRAEKLLRSSNLSEDDRRAVENGLDMAYSVRAAWMLALGLLPLAIYSLACRIFRGRKETMVKKRPHSRELNQFTGALIVSILASSPLAAFVFLHVFILGCVILPTTMYTLRAAVRWATSDISIGNFKSDVLKHNH
ncbi:hypothetical protein DEM27_06425 [Metarhizobium album]|uniref:Uncharacterized protein n=1 Tax=Metarhizobium album TaxID=2182425 RepID=A0A2U2DVC1_9HYPH|nr:hypothetical protein [Rhizobium album]PWE57268.1 hypothetical protein DEM27_06425 [Rhizobium album]